MAKTPKTRRERAEDAITNYAEAEAKSYEAAAAEEFFALVQTANPREWRKPYFSEPAYNPDTGNVYSPRNQILLEKIALKNGFTDPRWVGTGFFFTKSARAAGLNEFQGASKTGIIIRPITKKLEDLTEKELEKLKAGDYTIDYNNPKNVITGFRYFKELINLSQLKVAPAYLPRSNPDPEFKFIEDMISKSGVEVKEAQVTFPHYSRTTNEIRMPAKDKFISKEEWFATLLHEFAHAISLGQKIHPFPDNGTKEEKEIAYAREELTAEFTAMSLTRTFGINAVSENQTRYLKSWASKLTTEEMPDEFTKAIDRASTVIDKIKEYLPDNLREHFFGDRKKFEYTPSSSELKSTKDYLEGKGTTGRFQMNSSLYILINTDESKSVMRAFLESNKLTELANKVESKTSITAYDMNGEFSPLISVLNQVGKQVIDKLDKEHMSGVGLIQQSTDKALVFNIGLDTVSQAVTGVEPKSRIVENLVNDYAPEAKNLLEEIKKVKNTVAEAIKEEIQPNKVNSNENTFHYQK